MNDRQPSETTYDLGSDAAPSERIVEAVATETGRDPLQLRPLYEVIDPDALDALVERSATARSRLRIEYEGCVISVTPNRIEIEERPDEE